MGTELVVAVVDVASWLEQPVLKKKLFFESF